MITESVQEAAVGMGQGPKAGFKVQVSVTDGEETALKTTNARLGVIGRISILGSTGVVPHESGESERIRRQLTRSGCHSIVRAIQRGHMFRKINLTWEIPG